MPDTLRRAPEALHLELLRDCPFFLDNKSRVSGKKEGLYLEKKLLLHLLALTPPVCKSEIRYPTISPWGLKDTIPHSRHHKQRLEWCKLEYIWKDRNRPKPPLLFQRSYSTIPRLGRIFAL